MALSNDNYGKRILESLNSPLIDRITDLNILLDRCSLRELHDIFPEIVQSVFGIRTGGLGWGLRSTTKEDAPQYFALLHNFFSCTGPMLRCCYRLLNDAIKFELALEYLPHKLVELIQSGQFPMFYADIVNIDHFRRQVTSLSLNAFDFYILNFAIYATFPLHKKYPAPLQIHNDRIKTVYFVLTTEYLCNFLPTSPDDIVVPNNISYSVKSPQPMPVQQLQPKRSPKYLKIPQTNQGLYGAGTNNMSPMNQRSAEASPRAYAWRTESVLYFFVDTWMRYDVDESRDLPSSEFIRVVRLLVKQLHFFGNAAHLDMTSISTLRKIAQPMMTPRMYPFMKSIIGRWPLDSSLSVVMELWLSYIQPWRYTMERTRTISSFIELPNNNRFDSFIAENLVTYTQIFKHILRRFERLDFTSMQNAVLLQRLVKVFTQPTLANKLYQAEKSYAGNTIGFESTRTNNSFLRSTSSGVDWESSFYQDDVYTPIFGSVMKSEIEQFIRTAHISRKYVTQEINAIGCEKDKQDKSMGILRKFFQTSFGKEGPLEIQLKEICAIPNLLELTEQALCKMFDIEMPNISIEELEPQFEEECQQKNFNFSLYDNSDYLDISRISPAQMNNNLMHLQPKIDPTTVPIQSHECKILVRLLHQISCGLNEEFGSQFQSNWNRNDFVGKLTHQILYPPMTAQWFDKPRGVAELLEQQLPARLSLRFLGSYRTLVLLLLAMLLGYCFWGSSAIGVIVLFCISFMCILIKALLS